MVNKDTITTQHEWITGFLHTFLSSLTPWSAWSLWFTFIEGEETAYTRIFQMNSIINLLRGMIIYS